MLKKITGSILTIMLMTTMFLGAFSVAAPEPVHAAGGGMNVTASYGGTTYTIVTNGSIGDEITLATIKSKINVGTMQNQKSINRVVGSGLTKSNNTALKIESTGNSILVEFSEKNPPTGTDISMSFNVTQTHTHSWNNNSYSASGNVITATCQGSGTCTLSTNPQLTLSASDKTYDGSVVTATASGNTTWTTGNGLPEIKNSNITYSPTNSKDAGTYTASYKVGNATATQQFTISQKEIALSWGTTTFTYDGSSHVPTATATGLVGTDTCTVTVDGAQTNAGESYTATATGLSNSNYKLPNNKTKTFKINKAPLTLTGVTAISKEYDGKPTAVLNTDSKALTGMIEGDEVEIDQISGQYSDKNVDTGKNVSLEVTLKGADKDNYEVTSGTTLTADITVRTVTIKDGIIASDKRYNGGTDATLDCKDANIVNKIDGDDLSVTATGAFRDKNVAEDKPVDISGHTLTGNDASNYVLAASGNQTETNATIYPKELRVSGITASDKEYNGGISATVDASKATYEGKVGDDEVSIDLSSVEGNFADKNVGTNKPITFTFDLTGTDAGNYIAMPATAVTANITAKPVKVSGITVDTRQYDKTTDAPLNTDNATFADMVDGDTLTVSGDGAYEDPNAGNDKSVSISNLVLGGADAGNYTVASDSQSDATGTITEKEVKVSGITAENKTYDGNTDATLVLDGVALDDVLGDDDVSVDKSKIKGAFEDENVGTSKTVNISGYELTGDAKANYKLAAEGQQEQTKADISPKSSEDIEPTQKEGERLTYDGTEKKPTLVVKDDETGKDLREGEDYEVEYEGVEPTEYGPIDTPPTKEGDYIAVIKFKGNYEGEPKKVKFTIYPKPNDTLLAQMTAKGKKSMVIRWTKVDGADGYDIFFSKCNSKGKKYTPKLIKTVRGNSTFKFTKKKLKKRIAYKAYVRAFKMEGGRKQYISTSLMYHGFTSGYKGKYTDAKSVSVKQPNVSLSAGQTSKISASIKKVKSKKILIKTTHAPHLRYVSSNPYVATVDGSGVITAKGNGSCYVYAVATNGVRSAVAVTVK